jgi:hypothetical protein
MTQQEARDPGGSDCRYESHEGWNHKWTQEKCVKAAHRAAEEIVRMVEKVEMVGMVEEEETQWR